MEYNKKFALVLFVVSTAYFSGATLPADAEIFCHEKGNGDFRLLDTSDPGFDNGHLNHDNDLLGQECIDVVCEGPGFVKIIDDVCISEISIDNVTLAEGDSPDTTNFVFTVTRSTSASAISVDFDTADDTAKTVDGDYVANT